MTTNFPASVHQRLINHARAHDRLFNEVLQLYALQRFLYRLGESSYRDRFVLKGALMLSVWEAPVTRPTRDIDLLGQMDNSVETISAAVRSICEIACEEDGLRFDAGSVRAERVIEGASYAGVRVRFSGYLGTARIPMQVDVGFGDVLVPGPRDVTLPSLLDLPPAQVRGYSRESAIAEKLQIMVVLGVINSRMKDFFDIWMLATTHTFQGEVLCNAIYATFARRETPIVLPITALEPAFPTAEREAQWRAFMRRSGLVEPESLRDALRAIAAFLGPVLAALAEGQGFAGRWQPGGPWLPS